MKWKGGERRDRFTKASEINEITKTFYILTKTDNNGESIVIQYDGKDLFLYERILKKGGSNYGYELCILCEG